MKKNATLIFLLILLSFVVSGCAAKTKVLINEHSSLINTKKSSVTIMVIPEGISENNKVIDYIRKDLYLKLNDIGLTKGQDLIIKVIIDDFDSTDYQMGLKMGDSMIEAKVSFFNSSNVLISEMFIDSLNRIKDFEDAYSDHAEDELVKEVIKYVKQRFVDIASQEATRQN